MAHNFQADYTTTPHSAVLERIGKTLPVDSSVGSYGDDILTKRAREIISHEVFGVLPGEPLEIFFVPSGSAANRLALAILRADDESGKSLVACSNVAHILIHEKSSIKSLGYIFQELDSREGRVTSIPDFRWTPGVLCISNATECGSVYSLEEIACLLEQKHRRTKVHIDGARIANAAARGQWRSLAAFGRRVPFDTLSLGMKKNGGVFGDVLVVIGEKNIEAARKLRVQFGYFSPGMQMYAAQALALFEEGLWIANARKANEIAAILAMRLECMGVPLVYPVETNAVFVRLPQKATEGLHAQELGLVWNKGEGVMRFMCAYNTTESDVARLIEALEPLVKA
jgi:threonine aldolase